ncbi:MAG: TetR/AcrR family transcriptional regulator [Chloroflexi bacterium]|nr:MAG: TetR/AcrR family transcriptional regulator [Chloroflexota bacterium]
MSPRKYNLENRRAESEQTRARIVGAAQELLAGEDATPVFSIDELARHAGVARMTVYYQFGSKRGLLEAIFDSLAAGGLAEALPKAYGQNEPVRALTGLIRAFTRFWASERLAIRRLRALAVLDPEVEASLRERDERRREGLRVVLKRLAADSRIAAQNDLDEAVDILHMLTSFEVFDSLAAGRRSLEGVVGVVKRLAVHALDLAESEKA